MKADVYETKRLRVDVVRFDRYVKPWPYMVETVVGDIGIPHPVVITVHGNQNVETGDYIVLFPGIGPQVMKPVLFDALFRNVQYPDITEHDEDALAAIAMEKVEVPGA